MEDHLIQFSQPDVLSIRAKALVFRDASSVELLARVQQVAPTEATVLIIGETGTGKELLAREVHARSGRAGPFVAVNCGAFSESLIDAELFGHEVGAFTGASTARRGWFEAAHGGTLFLDEIGDLALALQVKLLRVLQERQVVRLGARRPTPVDVRLIAATNVDLRAAVQANHFRADLYFRLSVAKLVLPPLHRRPADILPLAEHFLRTYAARLERGAVGFDEQARQLLLHYPWPGNIRELENVVHYALIVCQGSHIRPEDLNLLGPLERDLAPPVPAPPAAAETIAAEPVEPLEPPPPVDDSVRGRLAGALADLFEENRPELFQQIEAAVVRDAFAWCEGNQVQTARLLGISRNVLRTLLKRHGLLADGPELVPAAEG